MLKDANLFKNKILEIKDNIKLAYFLKDNNIDINTKDTEIIKHFSQYLNFGKSEENGIIYDIRNKDSSYF